MSQPDFEAFAKDVLKDWPESGPDMWEIQDLAIKHGLLVGEQRTPPCDPEVCFCAEYHGTPYEPITCYRRAGRSERKTPQ